VVNLFANYYHSESLTFRVNIGNVFDEEYWTAAYRLGPSCILVMVATLQVLLATNFNASAT